jgi:mono/diheme cytochrome c family protein
MRVALAPDPAFPGLFTARGAFAGVVGTWELDIVVRRAGAPDDAVRFEVPIERPSSAELVPPADTGVGVPAPLAVAWALVPRGAVGWLVPLVGLVALVALGRAAGRRDRGGLRAGRAVLGVLVVASGLAVGSRALVDAANAAPATVLVSPGPSPATGAAIARGELVYRANCASCHGIDGDGDGPIRTLPPAGPLTAAVREASDGALAYRIAYGVAGTAMPPFAGQLSADERLDLIAYLRSRWGSP